MGECEMKHVIGFLTVVICAGHLAGMEISSPTGHNGKTSESHRSADRRQTGDEMECSVPAGNVLHGKAGTASVFQLVGIDCGE